MKSERLLRLLGLVDDDLIAEAEDSIQTRKVYNMPVVKWLAAAACFVLVAGVALWQRGVTPTPQPPLSESSSPSPSSELPMLTVDTEWGGAMGFEGYMAYDFSELVNANPWSEEAELTTLPVYRNLNSYDKAGAVQEPDLAWMEKTLLLAADSLGMDTENLEVTNDYPNPEQLEQITEKFAAIGEEVPPEVLRIGRLFIEDDQYQLEVDAEGTVKVEFKPPVKLPEGYDFTDYASYEELTKVAEYLKAEYAGYINMKDPVTTLEGGDYSMTEPPQQHYTLSFYEGAGDLAHQIISYNFYPVVFYSNEEGELWLARSYHYKLSEKLGDYPIITAEQARQLLSEGHYITTVPEDFPGAEFIRKTELVYRTGMVQTYMPYYRIYVELPSMEMENGLKTFGAYYVPAVQPQYIENMPIWDGSFN